MKHELAILVLNQAVEDRQKLADKLREWAGDFGERPVNTNSVLGQLEIEKVQLRDAAQALGDLG